MAKQIGKQKELIPIWLFILYGVIGYAVGLFIGYIIGAHLI